MTMTFNPIEVETLALPEKSRAKLLERLLLSCAERLQADEELARAWTEEAERRAQEMHSSGEGSVPNMAISGSKGIADQYLRKYRI